MAKEQERAAYTNEISDVIVNVVNKVIRIADKYSVDRDSAMQYFSMLFSVMVETGTFEHFGESGG